METFRIAVIGTLIWTLGIISPAFTGAQSMEEISIPATLAPAFKHLFDLAEDSRSGIPDPDKIAPILDFINSPKTSAALYHADGIRDAASAYYEFDIHNSLQNLLAYAYSPRIPWTVTVPSSARMIHWLDSNRHRQPSPDIGQYLGRLEFPVVVKGLQSVEITPDTHSGAYYTYDNHQVMILLKYRQRTILISVSVQMDDSDVGKKGYILGADEDWDYLYSDTPGTTIPGLGWVKSYIYRSSGINIYEAADPSAPKVRCAVFKWLRAGWSGINMVQRKHIYSGLIRFAKPVKEILEYPRLPAAESLAGEFQRIRELSESNLRTKIMIYRNILQKRYDGRERSRKFPTDLVANKDHWTGMSREEMESVLEIEYMKLAVGKTHKREVGGLFTGLGNGTQF